MYSCDICNLSFKYLNSLTSHKNIHQTLADNRCGICGVSFTDRKLYLRHSFEHADEPFVECDICSKRFFKENHLSEHIKSHMTYYVDCDLCKKTIKKGQLKQHIDHVHSEDQRQFFCTHCNKAFTSKLISLNTKILNLIFFTFRIKNLKIPHADSYATPPIWLNAQSYEFSLKKSNKYKTICTRNKIYCIN